MTDETGVTALQAAAIGVAGFSSLTDVEPNRGSLSWGQLVKRLSRHREFATKESAALWAAAQYRDGSTRGNAGVEEITAVVIDVDHHEPAFDLLKGLNYIAHTTYSHSAADPRWRVVLEIVDPIPAADWPPALERITHWLFPGTADDSC